MSEKKTQIFIVRFFSLKTRKSKGKRDAFKEMKLEFQNSSCGSMPLPRDDNVNGNDNDERAVLWKCQKGDGLSAQHN